VDDGRADLALDVVPHDGQSALLEPLAPVRIGGDENRDAVHEGAAGLQGLLGIVLGRPLGADGKIGDQDVRSGLSKDIDDVRLLVVGFLDFVPKIFP
jgi:hypothetical protein